MSPPGPNRSSRTRSPTGSRSGWRCSTYSRVVGARVADREISRAWLVDPASGREGPGEIVVTDGILEAITWLEGAEADGVDASRVIVAPGFLDLHAPFREPGQQDADT